MPYENLLYDIRDNIAVITLNRPEVLNALNSETMIELSDAVAAVRNDSEVRGALITGAGDKAFIAGADVAELSQAQPLGGKETSMLGQRVLRAISLLGKPFIAAINGYALGGGLELALACHLRIASENAMFGLPEVGLGIIPGFGGTQRLPRLVGGGRALELILTGESITAEEALRIGLVNRVVPPGEALAESEKMLRTIISKAPISVKMVLEAVHHGANMTLDEGLLVESNLFGLLCTTQDMKEGMNAFLEKREPKFEGK